MIDTILNLLFRCSHRHLTRPFTPLVKQGVPHGDTYVVCLDCTKQFAYDLKEMRIGKMVERSHNACVLPAHTPKPRKTKMAFTLGVAVPVAVLLGAALTTKKPKAETKREGRPQPDPSQSEK